MITKTTAAGAALLAGLLLGSSAPALAQASARTPATPARPLPQPAEAGKGDVIARVGDTDVTAEEIRTVIGLLDPRQQAALARDPALLSQTVRTLLANRVVLKEALDKKWDQRPAVMAQIELARENAIIDSYLRSLTTPPADYPGDADLKAVYDANATAFLVPRQFQIAQIFVAVPKDADKAAEDKARRRLDDMLKKLRQPGADFAALARSESDDAGSAEKGGELGWLAEAQLRPEIASQIVGLAKAGITEPIRLDDGWHVIKLMDTKASHTRPMEEVREALVERMRTERTEANRRAYVSGLLKQNPPAVNELALSRLLAASPAAAPSR
ncbi:peptidylprolyl isomerase [Blastochloris sulfoviridis]|uniref:Parvulin-like PPIase n=1 Tax=Blastochloris sulfoviridis TaxID=50712 RepID=A0A5M6I716_9HYPH|nr:peptidylprolyl isomerase [Blastochloris sulfoviridis]KAA5603677.1 peptidylprolyl isomerase [Blastochloris sulfoviridis]